MKPNVSKLSPQAYRVQDEIKYQYGFVYMDRLASNLNIPLASVRRSIGELRQNGFAIECSEGFVRLVRG